VKWSQYPSIFLFFSYFRFPFSLSYFSSSFSFLFPSSHFLSLLLNSPQLAPLRRHARQPLAISRRVGRSLSSRALVLVSSSSSTTPAGHLCLHHTRRPLPPLSPLSAASTSFLRLHRHCLPVRQRRCPALPLSLRCTVADPTSVSIFASHALEMMCDAPGF
jgi:hypothetical protein